MNGAIAIQQSAVPKYHLDYYNGGLNFSETTVGDYRLFIQDGGKIGIGTNNPSERLHIASSMDDVIQIGAYTAFGSEWSSGATVVGDNVKPDDAPTRGMEIISDHPQAGGRAIRMSLSDGIEFHGLAGSVTAGDVFSNELMRITNTGDVGIGTTTPTEKLDVVGNIKADSWFYGDIWQNDGSAQPLRAKANGNVLFVADADNTSPASGDDFEFYSHGEAGANLKMVITGDGNVGIGTASPQGALDVSSTAGALIVPRMTTAQRVALTAVNGMIIYNTDDNQFNFYENGAWVTK